MWKKNSSLTRGDIKKIPKSFDVVGDIIIFSEFPEDLEKKEKLVGRYLIKMFKNIKTVTKKTKFYSGRYRTPKLKVIAGDKSKETIHKENGVLLKVNPEKAYFSPRQGSERLRVAKLIKKGESVLTMFSGIAPFPLTISRHSEAKEIYGVEINPKAHDYAEENVKLNKIKNIKLFKGDVAKVLPTINKKFDRILMPLPKSSEEFLDSALSKLKSKGTIYLYIFEKEENLSELKKKYSKKFKIKTIKAGSPAPGTYRYCLEMKKL